MNFQACEKQRGALWPERRRCGTMSSAGCGMIIRLKRPWSREERLRGLSMVRGVSFCNWSISCNASSRGGGYFLQKGNRSVSAACRLRNLREPQFGAVCMAQYRPNQQLLLKSSCMCFVNAFKKG
eukprot:9437507-Pyramimonas_sp.AAC.2